jgi:hypothetical protein
LGLATPPCERTPLDLLDAAFIESVLDMLLGADLGSSRPTWIDLCPSHPLSGSLAITPTELCRRRFDVAAISWSEVRHRITDHVGYPDPELTPAVARWPDPELTPAVVRWLDDGSLARWLLARYPEPAQMLDDVCELLDTATAVDLRTAHSTVMGREREHRP